MKMSFDDNKFDAIYAIEATCHAPDPVGSNDISEVWVYNNHSFELTATSSLVVWLLQGDL